MKQPENAATPGDTIAAIATPPGRAGLGVIRVSGPRATAIGAALTGAGLVGRRATFRRFLDRDANVLDEGIAILFQAPASFTGEDVLEIHAHGSPVVLGVLLERVFDLGARPAHPGEFSQRAFLNGKYDLAQLEAIADLVNSSGIQAARSAQRVLQGEFSRSIARLSAEMKELRVLTEAALDFPEEDVDVVADYQLVRRLQALVGAIRDINKRAVHGARLNEGIELVIAGRPNAGKSSLLNRLSQTEEAIVSDFAGTTRDIVRSDILLDGIPLRVLDTAGIGAPGDAIEEEGMRRALRAMDTADVVLLLVDATVGFGDAEADVSRLRDNAQVLTVFNKADLVAARDDAHADVWISARTGEGLDELRASIKQKIGMADCGEDAIAARRRHIDTLSQAQEALERAMEHLRPAATDTARTELAAEGLKEAQHALATIVGDYATEDLLGDIFAGFCIGK